LRNTGLNDGNYQSTLRDATKRQRPHLYFGGSRKSLFVQGEVKSVKNTTINIWLNDGVY